MTLTVIATANLQSCPFPTLEVEHLNTMRLHHQHNLHQAGYVCYSPLGVWFQCFGGLVG